jgi:hypothetical protein
MTIINKNINDDIDGESGRKLLRGTLRLAVVIKLINN